MKEKVLEVSLLLLILFLLGCNHLRTFPLYSEVYIEHPNSIKLDYLDREGWWDYSTLVTIRRRVAEYLNDNPNIDYETIAALKELRIQKGMNKEQAISVVGEPAKKSRLKDGREVWIYKGNDKGVLCWYYGWGKLYFQDDILNDIEVQYIDIHK